MGLIIDTNALSAFFDGDAGVKAKLGSVDAVFLPVIVIGEYRFGLHGSRLRSKRGTTLDAFARRCTVLAVAESTTPHYAVVRHHLKKAGTPIPENDVWIAALALEHGLPVLSDDAHFDLIPQISRVGWKS